MCSFTCKRQRIKRWRMALLGLAAAIAASLFLMAREAPAQQCQTRYGADTTGYSPESPLRNSTRSLRSCSLRFASRTALICADRLGLSLPPPAIRATASASVAALPS